jgi:hypothetical protein
MLICEAKAEELKLRDHDPKSYAYIG